MLQPGLVLAAEGFALNLGLLLAIGAQASFVLRQGLAPAWPGEHASLDLLPHTVRVPAQRLADYLPAATPIDLLKLDVEGAESGILADLAQTGLLPRFRQVLVEYHYAIDTAESSQLAACLQMFHDQGFAYYFKMVYPRTTHSQDLILHCWQPAQP